jgi:hydrogenase nickel incorporation protein HypA/HybF
MHEFSIATQIFESVLEFAEARPWAEVLKVRLEIGELMGVEAEQLRFCYDSIKPETILKNSSLEISIVSAVVRCSCCEYEGPPKQWEGVLANATIPTLQCPQCGRTAVAVAGNDCAIKNVQAATRPAKYDECDPLTAIGAKA